MREVPPSLFQGVGRNSTQVCGMEGGVSPGFSVMGEESHPYMRHGRVESHPVFVTGDGKTGLETRSSEQSFKRCRIKSVSLNLEK
jgi:hypothetical protein